MAALRTLVLWALVILTNARRGPDSIDSPCDRYRDRFRRQPNIIYIMADDMGWNDVGFHNPKLKTPHLDALRADGIELTQSYVQPICTPTRASLMTGRYPSNTGLQLFAIFDNSQGCLPLEHKTLFEYMKEEGYSTNLVGKWHLGYCNETCMPLNRGIDEFRGVLPGDVLYFNWTNHGVMHRRIGADPSVENIGRHMTVQDRIDAEDIIMSRKGKKDPFIMWVTPTAPHAPVEVTEEMYDVYDFLDGSDPEEHKRREFLGLMSAVDDIVGGVRSALKRARLARNTIIVFSSDNGGEAIPTVFPGFDAYANNYPLRNAKYSHTEGGVRTPTIYYDPRLHPRTRGTERDFLIHVTDWLPTFVQLGTKGRKSENFRIPGIDGKSQLANLGSFYNRPAERKYNIREEMLVALTTIDTEDVICANNEAAFRWRDYKLIYGNRYYVTDPATIPSEWPKPQESPELPEITGDDCHRIVDGERVVRCLFNVVDDPSELHNLYDEEPEIVEQLIEKINHFKRVEQRAGYHANLGVNDVTAQHFTGGTPPKDYLIPRTDFCDPAIHSPLLPQYDFCPLP